MNKDKNWGNSIQSPDFNRVLICNLIRWVQTLLKRKFRNKRTTSLFRYAKVSLPLNFETNESNLTWFVSSMLEYPSIRTRRFDVFFFCAICWKISGLYSVQGWSRIEFVKLVRDQCSLPGSRGQNYLSMSMSIMLCIYI